MTVPPRIRGRVAARAERSFIARGVLRPVQMFIHTAGRSSIVLLAAAITALAWANSPWQGAYFDFWDTVITVDLGFLAISEDLRHWVNDALMVVFFFAVGLEIKHELVLGELSTVRGAALPILAALGGMVAPAAIYMAMNAGGEGFPGWGIPMATDIAFALGVLALLGRRIPSEARVFLLALAIVDDIGAILVIAVFYSQGLSMTALGIAVALVLVIFVMNRLGVYDVFPYVVVGTLFWLAVLKSGVHATIAGVILGIMTPTRPYYGLHIYEASMQKLLAEFQKSVEAGDDDMAQVILGRIEALTEGTEAPVERLERTVNPWSSYVILPLFALANAGIVFSGAFIGEAVTSPVTLGVMAGLLIGKPVGILVFLWPAVRSGITKLPAGIRWEHVAGVGMLAGIGFTVSLFITELAFTDVGLNAEAKIGILIASVVAGIAGLLILLMASKGTSHPDLAVSRMSPEEAAQARKRERPGH